MFKNWCMSEKCWIALKCLSVCCGWDLNYANCLRTCHVETVYVLWRNYVLNDFKVLHKMLDLFSFRVAWFSNCMISAWYSSEIYTGQAQNIEHTYPSSISTSSISISSITVSAVSVSAPLQYQQYISISSIISPSSCIPCIALFY